MKKKYKRKHSGWMRRTSNRYLKQLNLDGIKLISLESLKHVKRGKRGKFSRIVEVRDFCVWDAVM